MSPNNAITTASSSPVRLSGWIGAHGSDVTSSTAATSVTREEIDHGLGVMPVPGAGRVDAVSEVPEVRPVLPRPLPFTPHVHHGSASACSDVSDHTDHPGVFRLDIEPGPDVLDHEDHIRRV